MKYTPLVKWSKEGFVLKLWDTNTFGEYGKSRLAYKLYDEERLIFSGSDYFCSPLHPIEGLHSIVGLLFFLTLRPGDTDQDYFYHYTRHQLEWCRSGRCDELAYIASTLEERIAQ